MKYNIFCFDDYVLFRNEVLRKGEKIIKLPPKELQMLTVLVENAGKVITKEKIIDSIWKGGEVSDESLARCICSVRKRLGETKDNMFISTLYGKGYMFTKMCTFYENENEFTGHNVKKPTALVAVCRINNTAHNFNKDSNLNKYRNSLSDTLTSAEKLLKQLFYKEQGIVEISCPGIQKKVEKVLHAEPFNALALAIMGMVRTLRNDHSVGYIYLAQARYLEPDNIDIDFYYAWHLTLKGDFNAAQTVLNRLSIDNYIKYNINLLKNISNSRSVAHYTSGKSKKTSYLKRSLSLSKPLT